MKPRRDNLFSWYLNKFYFSLLLDVKIKKAGAYLLLPSFYYPYIVQG
jgi:hypothetical protein